MGRLFAIIIMSALLQVCKAQDLYNQVDSLGFKHGYWIEYRIIPSTFEINVPTEDKSDSRYVNIKDQFKIDKNPILIKQCGIYNAGLREGIWKEFWPNGNLKSEISYKQGVLHGSCKLYYGSGKLKLRTDIEKKSQLLVELFDEEEYLILKKKISTMEVVILFLKK